MSVDMTEVDSSYVIVVVVVMNNIRIDVLVA